VLGISGNEFVVLLVVAAVVLGPERLPDYAQQLARLIRELRRMARGATEQVRAELGSEFDDVDWRKLDPRQYDPRRIVREALADPLDPDDPLGLNEKPVSRGGPQTPPGSTDHADPGAVTAGSGAVTAGSGPSEPGRADADPPFDPDAT
jgi:sec-independent protein translocase protein TatB